VDEGFFFRDGGTEQRSLYRAIDEHGQVLDVLFRDHRDTEAAKAFFRRALTTSGVTPNTVVSDHHQPYIQAVREVFPEAMHVRTGLHRAHGETTKCVERSHIATRDRLRSSRGLKTLATGQRFFEGFEAVQALGRGHSCMEHLVPGYRSAGATGHAPGPGAGGGRGHHHVRVTAPPGSLTTASGPSHQRVAALELPQRLSEPLARC